MPGTGGKGRIVGPPVETAEERSSIAALYCALMCDQSLDAIGSKARIIIDGPFAENPVFLAILAALRPAQPVFASDLRDGTTAGAAVLALMEGTGRLPQIALTLRAYRAGEASTARCLSQGLARTMRCQCASLARRLQAC